MDKRFTRFKLDNIWSAEDPVNKDFNAFIVHDGVLEFFNTPGFSNEIVFPKLGDHSVFLGVEHEGLELEYQLLVKEVTMDGYRKFLDWLNFDSERKIYFDYQEDLENNPGYRTVRVSHISRGEIWFVGNCEGSNESLYNISLEVGFITVGDWAVNYDTEYKAILDPQLEGVSLENKGSLPMFFDIETSGSSANSESVVHIEASNRTTNDKTTIIKINENQGDFLLDTRTGILYADGNKDAFFKGKVTEQAVRYMLKPGESVTFSNASSNYNVTVTITGHRRDYI